MTSNSPLRLNCPAKVNLSLHICGRRRDGYHLLNSLVCLLNWYDQLELASASRLELQVTGRQAQQLAGESNLVLRAACLLARHCGITTGARLSLHKTIPPGAGLGGGSSNAAACLVGLNHLWNCGLNTHQLARLGTRLGADVPLFVYRGGGKIGGTGDRFTPFAELDEPDRAAFPAAVLLLVPDVHCDTARVYAAYAAQHQAKQIKDKLTTRQARVLFPSLLHESNQLVGAILREYPPLAALLRQLPGQRQWRFSGSGSSLFCCFPGFPQALAAARAIPAKPGGIDCEVRALRPDIAADWGVAKW